MTSFLITGAAGFIAFRVAQLLLEAGNHVVGVDNMNTAYDVRLKEYRLGLLKSYPNFDFHLMDICDFQSMSGLFESSRRSGSPVFDGVINLAARAGVRQSVTNPWDYIQSNITGTLNLLELCRRFGVQKFVLASTSSVYGNKAPLPTAEDAQSDHPLQPYAASKKGAEVLCYSYHYLYGIDITVFRYFTVYGPAGRPDMVMFRFTQWISEGLPVRVNGDGEQSRGFTYLDDIAQGTVLGLRSLGYEIINLGGHQVIKINDLIHLLEELIGRKANIQYMPSHPADIFTNWADTHKANNLLKWEPKIELHEGVLNMVRWYNSERNWVRNVNTE